MLEDWNHLESDQKDRLKEAYRRLKNCHLCPRQCGVARLQGERGACLSPAEPLLAAAAVHQGEEPPLSGWAGSGNLFLSGCNLHCPFCQNYPISALGVGRRVGFPGLMQRIESLAGRGVHNIHFVTPSHYAHVVLAATALSRKRGLDLPMVYNTSSYDSVATLELLQGSVDIYLADLKYGSDRAAAPFCQADDYWRVASVALIEMKRQVGDLVVNRQGLACRGLLVRHLVLPGDLSQTERVLTFIAERLGPDTALSLMCQYFPAHLAGKDPRLARRLTAGEYDAACSLLDKYNLSRGWTQQDEDLQRR